MAIPSLEKIDNDIKTLRNAGLLDPTELNRLLWPVAAIHLSDPSFGVQRVESGHKPLGREITAHPSLDPFNAQNAETSRGKTSWNAVEDIGMMTSESDGSPHPVIGHGLQPHTQLSEPSGASSTILDDSRSGISYATQDVVEIEGGCGAELADRDKGRGGMQQNAAGSIGAEGHRVVPGEQGADSTNIGVAGGKRSKTGYGIYVCGEASKYQDTDMGDQAVHKDTSNERVIPTATYPISSMAELPMGTHSNFQQGTKRYANYEESQPSSSKFQRSNPPGNNSRPTWISSSPQSGVSLISKKQQETQYVNTLRSQFQSGWAEKLPTFDAWHSLDRFASIRAWPDQQPYEELEVLMQRIVLIGTISSPHITKSAIELPTYFKDIAGFEAGPFQNFWKAMEVSRNAKSFKNIAVILRRKSLLNLVPAFSEVTKYVRQCSAMGKIKLRNGVRATAKAREILYSVLYLETETRTRMRSSFNHDQQCASAYVKLVKRFGNLGILAMIPSKLKEGDFRSTDARFAAFVELLDLVRPELNSPRLRF